MKPRQTIVPLTILLLAAISLSQTAAPSPSLGAEDPRVRGPQFAKDSAPEFAWLLLLNLVSPAKSGQRGVRDPGKSVGAEGVPSVWETYRNISTIYLPDGSHPHPWNDQKELPLPPNSPFNPSPAALQALGPVDSPAIHYLYEDRMIDGNQICTLDVVNGIRKPLIVRYDIRDDRAAFDYIVNSPSHHYLYNLDGQEEAYKDPKFTFAFPEDAIEIKASWRILKPTDDASRYWTAYIAWEEQGNIKFARGGLTGIHIISKILPKWFWATFEQADDAASTFTYFGATIGSAVGRNLTFNNGATKFNVEFDKLLTGTKWAFYQLQGWQTDFVDGSNQPVLLANTQMETSFEKTSSCMSCHLLANIGPLSSVRFDLWDMAGGNIGGYVGNVNFQQIAAQEFPNVTFKEMDYVWALRNAKPKSKGN